jgi:hypothetical protein
VEGGHPGSGNAILNNAENLIIGEPLRSWVFRDVGRALATSRVKTVTLGAAASKYLLALAGKGMDWIILALGSNFPLGGCQAGFPDSIRPKAGGRKCGESASHTRPERHRETRVSRQERAAGYT